MSKKLLTLNLLKLIQFVVIVTVISLALTTVTIAKERRSSSSSSYDSDEEDSDLLSCPFECDCKGLTVDCANRGLKFVPKNIPSDAKRIHLGGNNIVLIRREDFLGLSSVKILDLRQNEIVDVEDASFQGFTHLDELILFQNRLKEIRPGMFKGLKNLKTLLLNGNSISSVKKDSFVGLNHLNLLSLYDNQLESIPEGTFDPLDNVQTLHLGRNPFRCDCKLKWLSEYLIKYPIETTAAKCDSPSKFSKKKITSIDDTKLKCKEDDGFRMRSGILNDGVLSSSSSSFNCPTNCSCSGSSILKCNFYDPPAALAASSSTISSSQSPSSSFLDEDSYLDDRSGEKDGKNERNDLEELNKIALKHIEPNSNKISILMCQKGKCYPIEELDSFLHSCARILYIRKNRSKKKFTH